MKHQARKRFGQNFLQDEAIVSRMISAMRLNPDDPVIEVGPGLGALTLPLLAELEHLRVVEIDRDLIARLRQRNLTNLSITEGDVLNIDWQSMAGEQKLRVVGNLPYNIGTPLLLHLLNAHPSIKDVHVMLQKEVVDRLHAVTGSRAYGRLSVLMQSVFNISPLFTVPPEAFSPVPAVDSAVVRLTTRPDALDSKSLEKLQAATRIAFASKRKTLRNNLKGYLDEDQLHAINIDPRARAETLSLDDFCRLAGRLTLDTP